MKRLLVVPAAVLLFAGLFIVAAPHLVTIEAVRRSVGREITGWGGRALTFEGTPTIAFTPYLTVTFPKVTIASRDDNTPLVVMDSLSAQLRAFPILYGGIETEGLVLEKPVFRVARDAKGELNWTPPKFLVGGSKLGRLSVRNGSLHYVASSGATTDLQNVNANLDWPDLDSPAVVKGSAVWQGEAFDFNGSADTPVTLMAGTSSPFRLAIASAPFRASFNGMLRNMDGFDATGALTVSTPSLRRLSGLLGRPMADSSTLGAASIDADATLTRSFLSLGNAKISLDGNEGEGALGIDMTPDRPAIQGTLAFDKLDLSAYSEALQRTIAAARAAPDEPLGFGALDDNDLDVRISAAEVRVGDLKVQRAAASATVRAGRIDISLGDGTFDGGHLSASLSTKLDGDLANAMMQARVDGVVVSTALTDLFGVTILDGTGSGGINVNASGTSWNGLVRSLAGTADATITGGTVAGIDVGALASRLHGKRPDDTAMLDGTLLSGETAFTRATGKFAIDADKIAAQSVTIDGTGYQALFAGEAPLQGSTLSGRGRLSLLGATAGAAPTEIPFIVGGTWTSPRVVPDFGGLMRRTAREPARPTNVVIRFAKRFLSALR